MKVAIIVLIWIKGFYLESPSHAIMFLRKAQIEEQDEVSTPVTYEKVARVSTVLIFFFPRNLLMPF
jgi:hypothetical protein